MKPSKVAIFLPSLSGGGAERIALVLAEEFIRMGIRVDIVLAHFQGEYLNQIPDGVQIVDLKASRMALSIPKLTKYLSTQQPDIFLSTIDLANIIAFLALLLCHHKPVWIIRQANYPNWYIKKKSIKDHFLGFLLKNAFDKSDYIVAISKNLASHIQEIFDISDQKVSAIYNPALFSNLILEAQSPVFFDWFEEGRKVIISVGRLNIQKDFPTLIKAFAAIHQNIPETRLLILGEGKDREKLESLVKDLNLESFIRFAGFMQNPFAYMLRSKVFVMSSIYEGFGNVLVEALACGCPVVSTDCPSGPREILNNGEFGYLVPVGDSEAMAEAILEVLNGKAKPISQDWLSQYKPQPIAQQYVQIFENLMKHRSRV